MNAVLVTWMLCLAIPAANDGTPSLPVARTNQPVSLDDGGEPVAITAELSPGEVPRDEILPQGGGDTVADQSTSATGSTTAADGAAEEPTGPSAASVERIESIGSRVLPRSQRRPVAGGEAKVTGPAAVPWYRDTFVSLAVVLALIGAAYFAIRRWMPAGRVTEDRLLQVVARAVVSPKHQLVLINLGQRFELLGVSADRIHPVCSITDPREVGDLVARLRTTGGSGPRFDDLLQQEARSFQDAVEEPADPANGRRAAPASTQVSALLGKLKRLQSVER